MTYTMVPGNWHRPMHACTFYMRASDESALVLLDNVWLCTAHVRYVRPRSPWTNLKVEVTTVVLLVEAKASQLKL